jgi:hypothetical protein
MSEAKNIRDRFSTPRSEWGDGPWVSEPDKIQWTTESGLPGLIVRNHAGALCGYAGVPPAHPLYGNWYGDKADILGGESPEMKFEVHGGITYSDFCQGTICHVPEPGEPDNVFWFGFDCSHYLDCCPATEALERKCHVPPLSFKDERQYRDVAYVKAEVEKLAAQLATVGQED